MSILDWAYEQGNFNEQSSVVKFEFALVAKFTKQPNHPLFDGVEVPEWEYKAGLHWCMPERFPMPTLEEWNVPRDGVHSLDEDWLWKVCHDEQPTPLEPPYDENYVMLAHRVYWASFFSEKPLVNPVVGQILQDSLLLTDDPDDVARILIAKQCLGLTHTEEEEAQTATGNPKSWAMYHKHLTSEIFQAIETHGPLHTEIL